MRARFFIRLTEDANTRSPLAFFWRLSHVRITSFAINHKKALMFRGQLVYQIWYAYSSLHPPSIQYLYVDLTVKIRCLSHLQKTSSHLLSPGRQFCNRLPSTRACVRAVASVCDLIPKSHLFQCHMRSVDTFLLAANS